MAKHREVAVTGEDRTMILLCGCWLYTGAGGGESGVDGRSYVQQEEDAGTGGEPAAQIDQH